MKHTVDYSKLDTPQAVFDHCAEHLLTQKVRSKDEEGYCMYRMEDPTQPDVTLMCGVGCLISDADYVGDMEGVPVTGLPSGLGLHGATGLHELLTGNSTLLSCIQRMHDKQNPEEWLGGLGSIAAAYGLKFNHGHLA